MANLVLSANGEFGCVAEIPASSKIAVLVIDQNLDVCEVQLRSLSVVHCITFNRTAADTIFYWQCAMPSSVSGMRT